MLDQKVWAWRKLSLFSMWSLQWDIILCCILMFKRFVKLLWIVLNENTSHKHRAEALIFKLKLFNWFMYYFKINAHIVSWQLTTSATKIKAGFRYHCSTMLQIQSIPIPSPQLPIIKIRLKWKKNNIHAKNNTQIRSFISWNTLFVKITKCKYVHLGKEFN